MRSRFALTHLLSSVVVLVGVMALFFCWWFPSGYRELSGVTTLALWVLLVDLAVGPVCTFVVANPIKTARERTRDIAIIALVQFCALVYGVHVAWSARPALMVFEYSLFRVVSASELVSREKLDALNPENFQGVPLVALRPFVSPDEKLQMTLAAIAGYSLSARPELWVGYTSAAQAVIEHARPVSELVKRVPATADELSRMTTLDAADVGVLSVVGHQGLCKAVAVRMRDAHVLGILSADACSLKID